MKDELYEKSVQLKKVHGDLSEIFLQRKLRISVTEAKRILNKISENNKLVET